MIKIAKNSSFNSSKGKQQYSMVKLIIIDFNIILFKISNVDGKEPTEMLVMLTTTTTSGHNGHNDEENKTKQYSSMISNNVVVAGDGGGVYV